MGAAEKKMELAGGKKKAPNRFLLAHRLFLLAHRDFRQLAEWPPIQRMAPNPATTSVNSLVNAQARDFRNFFPRVPHASLPLA
jgi:hypothetical protein